jgi:hypothetical protein
VTAAKEVALWAEQLGAEVRREVRSIDSERPEDGKLRPADVEITFDSARFWVDCTIPNVLAPSHVPQAAKGSLELASQIEKDKHGKYDNLVRGLSVAHGEKRPKFVPLVVETLGGIGKEGAELLAHIAKEAKNYSHTFVPREVVYSIPRTVALAVQRGNAVMVRRLLRAAHD